MSRFPDHDRGTGVITIAVVPDHDSGTGVITIVVFLTMTVELEL